MTLHSMKAAKNIQMNMLMNTQIQNRTQIAKEMFTITIPMIIQPTVSTIGDITHPFQ